MAKLPDQMEIRNLSVLSYAQGFTHWHYRLTPDQLPLEVYMPNFWQQASSMLRLGDFISISGPRGGFLALVATLEPTVTIKALTPNVTLDSTPSKTNTNRTNS